MNNIHTAKSSLQAELAHVQSGLAYYQTRVDALHAALEKLDEIEEEDESALEPEGKKTRGRRKASAKAAPKKAKTERQSRQKSRLPATGGDFFPSLLNEQKQTMSDLLQAALAQLPFKASAEERTQMRARLLSAMTGMLKAGKAHDEGKGRGRVYFKA